MYTRLAFIAWAKIMYETNSYNMTYNIVFHDHFISETTTFYSFNVNRENGIHV